MAKDENVKENSITLLREYVLGEYKILSKISVQVWVIKALDQIYLDAGALHYLRDWIRLRFA